MQSVLSECYRREARIDSVAQVSLRRALSCYYSGNPRTGFTHGYVQRVVRTATRSSTVYPQGAFMTSLQRIAHRITLCVAALALSRPSLAAGGFDKVNTNVNNVNAILVTVSIAVVTISIIWAGSFSRGGRGGRA